MLYDLSPVVDAATPVWPGDTPFAARLTWSMAEGASVNVSALTTTSHLGSHVDAPYHTEVQGGTVAELGLEPYLGACRVVAVGEEDLVEPRHLVGVDLASPPRLLLKTGSWAERTRFPERFTTLSPALARLLVDHEALLVGIDTPSVDPQSSKTLETHHVLARGGVAILEGLVLEHVPEGLYELIALPLRLAGLDASPVRAVLRPLTPTG